MVRPPRLEGHFSVLVQAGRKNFLTVRDGSARLEPLGHQDMAGPALQYNLQGPDLGHVIQADLQKDHGRIFRKQRGQNLVPQGIALASQLHGLDQQLDR